MYRKKANKVRTAKTAPSFARSDAVFASSPGVLAPLLDRFYVMFTDNDTKSPAEPFREPCAETPASCRSAC